MQGTEAAIGSEGAARVGVRELRQNLSVYLDRVKNGETLVVTEHGVVVATLGPVRHAGASPLERLVLSGRATAPTRALGDLPRPAPGDVGSRSSAEVLAELRAERL